MLSMAQYQHLYLNSSENMNSPPNDDFRFWNFHLLNQKLKKQKLQSSQNLDLNQTCVSITKIYHGNSVAWKKQITPFPFLFSHTWSVCSLKIRFGVNLLRHVQNCSSFKVNKSVITMKYENLLVMQWELNRHHNSWLIKHLSDTGISVLQTYSLISIIR